MAASSPRLRSWLHVADHPSWHHEPLYSPLLAQALAIAYDQLHFARHRPDPYFATFAALVPFRDLLVCPEQRLNLEYALASAFTGDDSRSEAIACLSSAWETAEHLHDWGAQAELGYLEGSLWIYESQFRDAYSAYQDALESLRRLARDEIPADPSFELDLILQLAGCACEMGWFPDCLRLLDEAYSLRATWAREEAPEAANLAWIDANLARVTGKPLQALSQASAAADLLLSHGRPINRGRVHIVLAESALDVFELTSATSRVPNSANLQAEAGHVPSPTTLLAQARQAARYALAVAQEVSDPVGVGLARLSLRRATRISRPPRGDSGGIGSVERLLGKARRLRDPALQGRVESALADELLAAGYPDAARVMYQRAMRRLEEHYFVSLALRPRLALHHLDETTS
jgi:tetratricopeptide (TPR) repeat protein